MHRDLGAEERLATEAVRHGDRAALVKEEGGPTVERAHRFILVGRRRQLRWHPALTEGQVPASPRTSALAGAGERRLPVGGSRGSGGGGFRNRYAGTSPSDGASLSQNVAFRIAFQQIVVKSSISILN